MNRLVIVFLIFINSAYIHADSTVDTLKYNNTKTIIIDKETPITLKKFRPNFKNKYKNSSKFDYSVSGSRENLWGKIKFRIFSFIEDLFRTEISEKSRGLFSKTLNYISIIIVIVIIFFIVRAFVKKEALWFFRKSTKNFKVEYNDVEKNLNIVDFNKLIAEAIEQNKLRLAIRYHYLLLLKVLSKNNIIVWDLEKTNSDYMYEIEDKKIRKTFNYLSYIYNNIWYGEFEIDLNAYEKARNSFDEFINQWENE